LDLEGQVADQGVRVLVLVGGDEEGAFGVACERVVCYDSVDVLGLDHFEAVQAIPV